MADEQPHGRLPRRPPTLLTAHDNKLFHTILLPQMTRFAHALMASLMLLMCTASAFAVNITGSIQDAATNEPLIEATVRLLAAKDSVFVKGVTTNNNGGFTLRGVNKGKYILAVTYLGYTDHYQDVTVGSSNVRLGSIGMHEASEILGELEVVAVKTPIKVMEDTVEYNVDSYHTQPNAVVEDLLKRLPGVEVDSDGKITANGKTISKFLVNGKDFFSDDPQVASKNLPVDMIDKLQVIDRKSEMARLTGVDDGEDETVINLTVKKGMDNGWFGNAEAGYGTDDRYSGSFNVNRFWNGNQITFLGNLNNINRMGFTDSNGSRFRGPRGSGGNTISRAFGVNFNVGKEEIFRVGGDIIFTNTDRTSTKRQDRQYIFSDSTSYSHIRTRNHDRSNNVSASLRIKWDPDSFNTMEFRPQFSFNHQNGFSGDSTINISGLLDPVSKDFNFDNATGSSYEFSGRLVYTHRFKSKRGRSFSVSGNYRMSNVREYEDSYSHIMYMLQNTEEVLDQYADNHTWSNQATGRLTWTEPLGNPANGYSLVFAYRANYKWNNADKFTYNIPDDYFLDILPPVGVDPDPDYSNSYRNHYFNQDIRAGFKKVSRGLNYEVGMSVVPQMTKSINYIKTENNMERWVWNYAPYLRLRYKFSKNRSFQADYRGRTSEPSLSQLQPVEDISNPMNVKQGNPDLKPSFSHDINFRFNDYNPDAQRAINLGASFNYTQNGIISKTSYNRYPDQPGKKYTTYVNVNGDWTARLNSMISMPLSNKKWTISNHLFGNASQKIGFNNDVKNTARDFNIFESPGIAFRPDNFEIEIRPNYRVQFSTNSVQTSNNRTVQAYGGRLDATYYTPWGLTIQSDVNYSATRGYSAGYDQNTWRWNASISQQFLHNRALTLQLRVYDLLKQVNNISRSITANYIDDTETNSLTRYFMLSLSYRFNTFGKGNEPKGRDDGGRGGRGGWGGPGGGRPGGFGGGGRR